MNSSLKYALCAALVGASVGGCGTGTAEVGKQPTVGIRFQLDAERNRVWLLTKEGAAIYEAAAPDRVLQVPLPGWQFAGEPYGCMPDLALGPNGEAVITSDVEPVLWSVDPRTLAVTRHEVQLDVDADRDVGFTSLRFVPLKGEFVAVSGLQGSIWHIDGQLRHARRVLHMMPRMTGCGARASSLR